MLQCLFFGGRLSEKSGILRCLECGQDLKKYKDDSYRGGEGNRRLIEHYTANHQDILAFAVLRGATRVAFLEDSPIYVYFEEGPSPFEYTNNKKPYFKEREGR